MLILVTTSREPTGWKSSCMRDDFEGDAVSRNLHVFAIMQAPALNIVHLIKKIPLLQFSGVTLFIHSALCMNNT